MLFGNNDDNLRDRVIYKTKPNMLLGCKKAIYGVILLVIILFISPMLIKFIGEMQVYLISHIKLSLTRYAAIAFFVIILIDVVCQEYCPPRRTICHTQQYRMSTLPKASLPEC